MKKLYNFIKRYYFIIIVIVSIIVKYILTINLPINAKDEMGADEYLTLYQAENLIKGNYLGPYDYLTLVKGIGFPLCRFVNDMLQNYNTRPVVIKALI